MEGIEKADNPAILGIGFSPIWFAAFQQWE